MNLRRSKGYEGFAASKDGKFLYGLLEGPLWDAEKKDWEKVDGKEAARILARSIDFARRGELTLRGSIRNRRPAP